MCLARLVQVCRTKARSRYRRHFLYRRKLAVGGRDKRAGHRARAHVGHTVRHSGGKTRSTIRPRLARFLPSLRRSPDLFGVQLSSGGFPGLAGGRGPSYVGGPKGRFWRKAVIRKIGHQRASVFAIRERLCQDTKNGAVTTNGLTGKKRI